MSLDEKIEAVRRWHLSANGGIGNAAERLYAKVLRPRYLREHPVCEFCRSAPSEVIEHTKGRKDHFLDVSTFKAACKPCERLYGFDGRAEELKAYRDLFLRWLAACRDYPFLYHPEPRCACRQVKWELTREFGRT